MLVCIEACILNSCFATLGYCHVGNISKGALWRVGRDVPDVVVGPEKSKLAVKMNESLIPSLCNIKINNKTLTRLVRVDVSYILAQDCT